MMTTSMEGDVVTKQHQTNDLLLHQQQQLLQQQKQAIEWSNTGARLIVAGRHEEAAAILLDAVRQVRDGAGSTQDLLLISNNLQDTPPLPSERKTLVEGNNNNNNNNQAIDDGDYVYSTPIFLPTTEEEEFPSPTTTLAIQLSIVFNFAIARHMRSLNIKEQPKRDNKLRTTLKLYNWALTIERSIKDDQVMTRTTTSASLIFGILPCLGLINNCAQIHRTLHKREKADRMFRILLSSLMLLKEQQQQQQHQGEGQGHGQVKTDELDGFFSATSHLILKTTGVARAA